MSIVKHDSWTNDTCENCRLDVDKIKFHYKATAAITKRSARI